MRNGRKDYVDGFPFKDLNWNSYFHDVKAYEIIGWQVRTISKSEWENDE
jgi:hypothetical protein